MLRTFYDLGDLGRKTSECLSKLQRIKCIDEVKNKDSVERLRVKTKLMKNHHLKGKTKTDVGTG